MKKLTISLLLCLSLLLAGCSSNQNQESNFLSTPSEKAADNYGAGDFSEQVLDVEEASYNEDAGTNENNQESGQEISTDSTEDTNDAQEKKKDQKLVYTCDLTIESLEYDQTVKAIKEQITKYDGIIEEETESDTDTYWYRSNSKSSATKHDYIIIRIPSNQYESFLETICGNGKVTQKSMRVENITKRYSEIQTTITSLTTQEKRLLEMMDQAKTIDEMITVETRLTEVQNELAQYKNSLASLDTDVAYSTINLNIDEVVEYDAPTSTFGQRFSNIIDESKDIFLSFLENSLFAIILFGPIILVIAIVIIVIVKIIKAIRRKRRGKKNNEKPENKGRLFSRKKKELPEKEEERNNEE